MPPTVVDAAWRTGGRSVRSKMSCESPSTLARVLAALDNSLSPAFTSSSHDARLACASSTSSRVGSVFRACHFTRSFLGIISSMRACVCSSKRKYLPSFPLFNTARMRFRYFQSVHLSTYA